MSIRRPAPAVPSLSPATEDADLALELFGPSAPPAPTTAAGGGTHAGVYRVARDVMQQDAVRQGGADRDNEWSRAKAAGPAGRAYREEKKALGTAHPEFFEFTPGTRTIAPRALDPFAAFDDTFRRWVLEQQSRYEGLSDQTLRRWAGVHGVSIEPTTRETPTTLRRGDAATPVPFTVGADRGGYHFTASHAELWTALDTLAAAVRQGAEAAVGPAASEQRGPASLVRLQASRPPAEQARRVAFAHFLTRDAAFADATTVDPYGPPVRLMPEDLTHAAALGVRAPAAGLQADGAAITTFRAAIHAASTDLAAERHEAQRRLAYTYFANRVVEVNTRADKGLAVPLRDEDLVNADRLGVPHPAAGRQADLPAIRALLTAAAEATRDIAAERAEEFDQRTLTAGEAMERTTESVGRIERVRTDRYIDRPAPGAAATGPGPKRMTPITQ